MKDLKTGKEGGMSFILNWGWGGGGGGLRATTVLSHLVSDTILDLLRFARTLISQVNKSCKPASSPNPPFNQLHLHVTLPWESSHGPFIPRPFPLHMII